ncbi:MAG: hypothetical protein AAF917_02265 [Pseudomonadota bacterium]
MRASLAALLLLPAAAFAQWTVTEGTALSPDIAADQRIAFDLLGRLWILPKRGSLAQTVDTGGLPVREPRFSADGAAILFQTRLGGAPGAAIVTLESGAIDVLPGRASTDAVWRPHSRRVTLSSGADGNADLFDHDLNTGLRHRLTALPGSETDPAWSANGRDLAYIHVDDGRFRLMLRRYGSDDEVLLESTQRLSSPSWRPDGSLLTYLRHGDTLEGRMLILSEPLLDRELLTEDDLFDTPVAWAGRQRMVYAANGSIRRRDFNSWIPRDIPFRATIKPPPEPVSVERPPLPAITSPDRQWALRVSQVLSAEGDRFLSGVDVMIREGRIDEIGAAPSDAVVLDLGDAWLVPGLIDAQACLPAGTSTSLGPRLLSLGVTTLVAASNEQAAFNTAWSGVELPGPLLLPTAQIGPVSDLADGTRVLAANVEHALEERWSPTGRQYADAALTRTRNRYTYLSGVPQDSRLRSSRPDLAQIERATDGAALDLLPEELSGIPPGARVVLGSGCRDLPPGPATLRDIQYLLASGRSLKTVLRAATRDAADALAIPAGRIDRDRLADLVILSANPLTDRDAWNRVIAVVRNGRFFSYSGLVDKASVEKTYK